MPPRNRKERRAAQASTAGNAAFDPASIPLSRPSVVNNSSPNAKARTLYEIAAEREAELKGIRPKEDLKPPSGTEFVTISPSGEISRVDDPSELSTKNQSNTSAPPGDEADVNAPIPPLPDTIFISMPLSVLHFTLSFLAAHQYAQEIPLQTLLRESAFVSFPTLTFLIHLAHGHIISFDIFNSRGKEEQRRNGKNGDPTRQDSTNDDTTAMEKIFKALFPPSAKSIIFVPVACFLGGRLIAITNEASYYAVMKKAPSLGTLWVWLVLELSLIPALLAVLVPIGWAVLFKGYGII
ncbi:hypothetical protein PAAG_02516 [Paracoccidioides lutzii Pb01]|uniref:DUF7719 domain-containing protein n=1 Tax=Paracoccidioides lutzii (strain ATCC MYA-826 / Pb01) TaxID=502779 RepID=C1GV43_PARBA|nr:hypothetical protein PAAG_02516 [Paracoccidioides lutzii Pb01]EEH40461.1 hypothetical protein PAAG_02516 [Paracoccidioides lutzii Pb01]